jgi:hypothetical protein
MGSLRFDIEKKTLSKLLLHFASILLQLLAHSTKVIARGAFVAPVRVCTTEVYTQGTVLLLEVSTPQGPERHLDMSTLKRLVLLL